jgi:hypothetical protein
MRLCSEHYEFLQGICSARRFRVLSGSSSGSDVFSRTLFIRVDLLESSMVKGGQPRLLCAQKYKYRSPQP